MMETLTKGMHMRGGGGLKNDGPLFGGERETLQETNDLLRDHYATLGETWVDFFLPGPDRSPTPTNWLGLNTPYQGSLQDTFGPVLQIT